MSSRSDRFDANAAIFFSGCCCCCIPIRDPQYLDVRVRANGPGTARIDQALISVYATGTNNRLRLALTDNLGDAIIRIAPGAYDVRAQKVWHAPDNQLIANQNLNARDSTLVRFTMQPLSFHLHVDGDRNGQVDNRTEAPVNTPAPAWAWGANGRGAILPVNIDEDNATNASDAADNVINGVTDANSDIAHIEVRRVGGNAVVPVNWTATLEVRSPAGQANPENNARIFDGVANGDTQLVGPGAQQAALPAWPVNADAYGMEATRYAGTGFNGIISVRLTVNCPDPLGGLALTYYTEAQMRAASWLMPNHLDRSDTVYVTRITGNLDSQAFINTLSPLIDLPVNQGGAGSFLSPQVYNDQWMQDCMEIGYSTWPGTGGGVLRMESTMRAHRTGEPLYAYPQTLRGVNFGYTDPGVGASTTFDSTGNLEVTPPATATNAAANGAGPKHYPWGRIYYGRGRQPTPFNANVQAFLDSQQVQKPIALNTDWLYVGHVDEMMSFIPTPGGNKDWKLLIANPTRAYAILNQVNGGLNGGNGNTPVMQRLASALQLSAGQYEGVVPGDYWERRDTGVATTVGAMLGNGNSPIANPEDYPNINPTYNGEPHNTAFLTWDEIKDWNEGPVQNVLNAILATLVDEIDLDLAHDVIEVPVIFIPEDHLFDHNINVNLGQNPLNINPGQPGGFVAGALTADMVNLLVANTMIVVPKAFGPETNAGDEFELYLSDKINNANNGLRVRYIDDWNLYHSQLGEVHCGTNTLRKPANMNQWLQSAAAKWWEFPG